MPNVDEAAVDAFLAEGTPETTATDSAKNYATPEPSTQEAAPAAAEEAADIPAPAEEDSLPEGDTFDRAYVEKLRQESANYRTRAKKFQEAFDGYEDEAVSEWLELATTLRSDPRSAASRFQELAEAINEQLTPEQAEALQDQITEAVTEDAPITKSEFERMWAEKQAEIEQANLVREIQAEAEQLGYQKGTRDYDRLLWEAQRLPSASLEDAHKALQTERQSVIDAYVKEMGGTPSAKVPGKDVGGESGQPQSFEDFDSAKVALDAWLASQGAADGGKVW